MTMMSVKEPSVSLMTSVYAGLLVLLGLSIWLSRVDLGWANMPGAMLIATVKALLILLVFMRVRYGNPLIWMMASAGFVWLTILLVLAFSDYLTRSIWSPIP